MLGIRKVNVKKDAKTKVASNELVSEKLIEYLESVKSTIKVTSSVTSQATYNALLDVIIRVSKEDLAEAKEGK